MFWKINDCNVYSWDLFGPYLLDPLLLSFCWFALLATTIIRLKNNLIIYRCLFENAAFEFGVKLSSSDMTQNNQMNHASSNMFMT